MTNGEQMFLSRQWQLPSGHVGSQAQGVDHCPALEAHRQAPRPARGCEGVQDPQTRLPYPVGQLGAFSSLGNEAVLLNEELARALISQRGSS